MKDERCETCIFAVAAPQMQTVVSCTYLHQQMAKSHCCTSWCSPELAGRAATKKAEAPLENNMVARLRADFTEEFKRHRSHSEKNEDRIEALEKRVEALMGLMEVRELDKEIDRCTGNEELMKGVDPSEAATGPEDPEVDLGVKGDWVLVHDSVVGDFYRPAAGESSGFSALTPEEWRALPDGSPAVNPRERVVHPVAIVRAVRDDLIQQGFTEYGPIIVLCDTILEKLRKNFPEDSD